MNNTAERKLLNHSPVKYHRNKYHLLLYFYRQWQTRSRTWTIFSRRFESQATIGFDCSGRVTATKYVPASPAYVSRYFFLLSPTTNQSGPSIRLINTDTWGDAWKNPCVGPPSVERHIESTANPVGIVSLSRVAVTGAVLWSCGRVTLSMVSE